MLELQDKLKEVLALHESARDDIVIPLSSLECSWKNNMHATTLTLTVATNVLFVCVPLLLLNIKWIATIITFYILQVTTKSPSQLSQPAFLVPCRYMYMWNNVDNHYIIQTHFLWVVSWPAVFSS